MSSYAAWGAAFLVMLNGCANAQSTQQERPSWLARPWEMRYFIRVLPDEQWRSLQTSVALNSRRDPTRLSFAYEPLFEAATFVTLSSDALDGTVAIVIIEFDRNGRVTSNSRLGSSLQGRISSLSYAAITREDRSNAAPVVIGQWLWGRGEESSSWAPSLCDGTQMPTPFSRSDERYLYGAAFKPTGASRTFGCREWALQLYDASRPYIDVTSYVPKDDLYKDGAYIREFIGWGRFGEYKPVIGQHAGRWFCLQDCPGNAMPSHIPDVDSWAAAQGWPSPRPPTTIPVLPDDTKKAGVYPR